MHTYIHKYMHTYTHTYTHTHTYTVQYHKPNTLQYNTIPSITHKLKQYFHKVKRVCVCVSS